MSFIHTTSLTVEERNSLIMFSRSFLPVWYRAGVVSIECLQIFGTYSVGFILGSYIFHGLTHFENYKASSHFAFISLFWNCYEKGSINRMNWSSKPLS